MALPDKTLKQPRGYGRTGFDRYHEIAQGVRPELYETAKPANWLPARLEDKYNDEWWVILAGTIVSMERTIGGINRIVPANGGALSNIVYSSSDVNYAIDVDSVVAGDPILLAAAKTASKQLPANKPIGWAWHNYYSGSIEDRLINYEIQPFVSIVCDYEIEIPLIAQVLDQAFVGGDLIKPGVESPDIGVPALWVNGVDSVEQICGRVLFRETIESGANSRDAIHMQKPVSGLGLTGVENNGVPRHLDCFLIGSTATKASEYARINITLL